MKAPLPALVIDDDSQVRNFVAMILNDLGWSVTQADSAEQAFELATSQSWPVVFCDVRLGGRDSAPEREHGVARRDPIAGTTCSAA